MRWPTVAGAATPSTIEINHPSGSFTLNADQTTNGGEWHSLENYIFAEGNAGKVTIRNDGATGTVIADTVRFVRQP